jgi:selenocysteine lyase/cysteine desulfurase
MSDTWALCRAETPGAEGVLHLNHAGASLMAAPVLERYHRHIDLEARIGGYEAADAMREEDTLVYVRLARLLNCRESEIALLDSATRAWAMAFASIPFQTGDRILTSESEYASNFISYLQQARRVGLSVEVVPSDETGALSLDHLREMMDERVRLVAVTHVPTNGGLINPICEIGQVTAEHDCFYLVDACQSVGQLALDVAEIGCDFLSGTGRKYLRGPRGTGFLYVSHRALSSVEPPMLDLHSATWTAPDRMHIRPDGKCFEMWEYNVAARLAFSEAVAYALDLGVDRIEARVRELGELLRGHLSAVPGLSLLDQGLKRCGIVAFNLTGFDAETLVGLMRQKGVNLCVSPARHTLLDMNRRGLDALVRASVHYTNTPEELERFAGMLREL